MDDGRSHNASSGTPQQVLDVIASVFDVSANASSFYADCILTALRQAGLVVVRADGIEHGTVLKESSIAGVPVDLSRNAPVWVKVVAPVTHGVECYEAWRDERQCPHEVASDG